VSQFGGLELPAAPGAEDSDKSESDDEKS
jgi:hypothetical protein